MAKDLTIYLEDRPGTLAEVGEALGKAGVNIDGACGFPSDGRGVMHILVDDADAARQALESAGVEVGDERDVQVVTVVDQPGEMGRHLRRVAEAGVNVNLMYLATGTRMVLGSDDPQSLRRALTG